MTRWENYLTTAEKIIDTFDGTQPLHHFLKAFFKQHPHMGSRDRRWVSQLVYAFYRLGQLWKNAMPVKERIFLALFLCDQQPNELLTFFRPNLATDISRPLTEKWSLYSNKGSTPALEDIFPFTGELSPGVDPAAFTASFLSQPQLFIRTRNNKQQAIINLLLQAGINHQEIGNDVLSLPNSTKIDTIITNKSWYEIQDASSRQTGQLLHPKAGERWWDCCAASGGKSLLLLDKEPRIRLTVSDIRKSILHNLEQRFRDAGVKQYESKILDLSVPLPPATFSGQSFDHILLDAPCSGAGTWARTPENLYFFHRDKINAFRQLQQRIAINVIPFLKQGGTLTYITCSVFREENEAVIQYLLDNTSLEKETGGIITGYTRGADSMFAVQLRKA
ncbi:RsmB/NOP family class I SAM-dependent RNA methyltransferase [Chitinophaga pendula]|uniref:RsmB/NOP family class I SAM-dependent RNA methyltransferase n=1 Tax=Chitinophaga TaxID=79328 RepID=UPI000BAE7F9B|nr:MULTISPECIES: RsmB/NOP family class I SAM-dependent RNA methyltransferase [Chitinophaga]ASZ14566.1 RNA methyltransferase [Chitinophaga sp. MD30]UCJ07783.1 RsmB/NOP family class I SAM-dependent RNA methyltransferase [Chitinophaga pendula]